VTLDSVRKTLKMKHRPIFFYAMLPDFRQIIDFWKSPQVSPICLSDKTNM